MAKDYVIAKITKTLPGKRTLAISDGGESYYKRGPSQGTSVSFQIVSRAAFARLKQAADKGTKIEEAQ